MYFVHKKEPTLFIMISILQIIVVKEKEYRECFLSLNSFQTLFFSFCSFFPFLISYLPEYDNIQTSSLDIQYDNIDDNISLSKYC